MLEKMLAHIAAQKGAKFASFTYTAKESGEVAKFNLILGGSTEEMYHRDIPILERAARLLDRIGAREHVRQAVAEVLASRRKSLDVGIGNNPAYNNADTYLHLAGIPGVKMHKTEGTLYVNGLVQRKTVLAEGVYKTVNSSPKTIAKKKLGKLLPSGKFRMFALGNISRAALNGDVLEIG